MTTEERLEKVEGQLVRVRWINRCLIVAVVVCLAAWFILKTFGSETVWAKSGPNVLRASALVIEDENGKPCATLGMGNHGLELSLWDEIGTGKICAMLRVAEEGPMLVLSDENGVPRLHLDVTKDGPAVSLHNEIGRDCAGLWMGKEGPMLGLSDDNGNPRIHLEVTRDGLGLHDENGMVIWKAP